MTAHDRADGPDFFWFLPTHGDGRYLGSAQCGRGGGSGLSQAGGDRGGQPGLCRRADPHRRVLRGCVAGRGCPGADDRAGCASWSRCAQAFSRPPWPARMTATLDRLSDGRALINVVAGGDPVENRGDGINLAPADRYALTREFLTVYRRLLQGERVDFDGAHIRVEGRATDLPAGAAGRPAALFRRILVRGCGGGGRPSRQLPELGRTAGRCGPKIRIGCVTAPPGRAAGLSYGVRLHVIVRETEAEAWRGGRAADRAPGRQAPSRRPDRSSAGWIRRDSSA